MSHLSNDPGEIIPAAVLTVLTLFLFLTLFKKRRETQANALDWPMAIFGGTFLLGVFQLLKIYFHDSLRIYSKIKDESSLGSDPTRVIHLIVLIILYFMAEQFLNERLYALRVFILGVMVGIYTFLTLYFIETGIVLYNDEVISYAQHTTLDSLVFDSIQLMAVIMISYAYYLQFKVSDQSDIKRSIGIILLALGLYLVSSILEVLEHLINIVSVNAFLTSIPTFVILAYFYIKNPNFVYLAPTEIQFLQLVSSHGELLYAAEFKDALQTQDFLIGPSLTSVGAIISELVSSTEKVGLKKFEYKTGSSKGFILFEQVRNISAIIQTNRPSQILKRAMRYFVREFYKNFEDQIENFTGRIDPNSEGVSPDDVFLQCIPIVQSKIILFSFSQ